MANVWAIKNGDWSDPTLWNTGALPTSSDDVYANNFNINVNQNIDVVSLRNTVNTGITAGGTFTFNTGGVTANISNNLYVTNAVSVLFISVTASTGNIILNIPNGIITAANINNTMISHTGNCNLRINAIRLLNGSASGNYCLSKSSLGLLEISAEILGGNNFGSNGSTLVLSSASTTVINGNVIGGSGNNAGSRAISINYGSLFVNGNVIGGNLSTNNLGGVGLFSSTPGDINIIGNVAGNGARAISINNGILNITGTISGSSSEGLPSVDITGNVTLNHIGTAQASLFGSAITCNTPIQSTIISTGPFLKNGYIVAVASQTLRINFNSNSYFQFKKSNGDDIDYVSTIEGYNYPTPADVRHGVSYKSGLAVGTCHVPSPDNVRKNIPVDNTVGTSDNVNAEDILEAIQNSNLPIAARLRNVATVESTGAQLEAYQ